jgi:hypothetical protein
VDRKTPLESFLKNFSETQNLLVLIVIGLIWISDYRLQTDRRMPEVLIPLGNVSRGCWVEAVKA